VKVLFIYKFLTMGGVETVLRVRLEGLPRHDIDAHAWFLFDGPGRVIFEGMEPRTHVGSTAMLRDFFIQENFDLVSSLDTEEVFPTIRKLRDQPLVVIEAHSPYPENLEYLRFLGDLPVAAFFVPSSYQAEVIRTKIGTEANIQVIPNPLAASFGGELGVFSPRPPRPVVAWIGRLDDLKNWVEFIDIAGHLRETNENTEFWIVGRSGGEEISQALYKRAQRAGILDRLRWYRGLPYGHIPTLLDAVRVSGGVVVSTSKGDSFGLTIAEGMARGCAVVVPSEGPFREFVTDGVHGWVYPLGSSKDGAEKIDSLLKNDLLRSEFGQRGRVSILDKYGTPNALNVLASTLQQLFQGKT
jgi:glycosyltransferase involved in cell wall biosynthesis